MDLISVDSCYLCNRAFSVKRSKLRYLIRHDKSSPPICLRCVMIRYREENPDYVASQREKSKKYNREHPEIVRFHADFYHLVNRLWRKARLAARLRAEPWREPTLLNKHIMNCYYGMSHRTKYRKGFGSKYYIGLPFNVSKDEFYYLAMTTGYPEMFQIYLSGGKKRGDAPSVDRIDSNKGYVSGNIRFIPQRENCRKARLLGLSRRLEGSSTRKL